VGGVVGLLALLLVAFFVYRRKHQDKSNKERPVDLLQGDEGDGTTQNNHLPQYYEPEPFIVPDPTSEHSPTEADTDSQGRPLSGVTSSDGFQGFGGATSVGSSSRGAKSAAGMRPMRAVNIIQHDDAGPSEAAKAEEPETVELPPAYTNIRK
jgi:hypothetical protein